MLGQLKEIIKKQFGIQKGRQLPLQWIRKAEGSWLATHFQGSYITPAPSRLSARIEELAAKTNAAGPQPLWEGYKGHHNKGGATRMPESVRTVATTGNFYSWLVETYKPEVMVEFGTAFGVSGMYFLAGLEANNKGSLYTFEPNEIWRNLAVGCLQQISKRFTSTAGTFEDNVTSVLGQQRIDMAFIDAIHTKEFVMPQLELVVERCGDHAIIILDDINFSDNMRDCWQEVSHQSRFVSSLAVGDRVGIVEFRR